MVPHPAHGSPGWWTFIPLVGTGPSLRPPKPRPQGPGREVLLAHPAEVARIEHEHDAGLEALVIQLQAERAAITSLSDEAACRLCGTHAPLTPEHAPSRAAGNSGLVLGGRVDDDASHATGRLTWTEDEDQPDGATVETLCGPCNHRTGRQFYPSYVVFAKACESVAQPESAGTRCAVGVVNRPLVAKQALVSLIATSQPGLTSRYPHLRTLLETSSARGPLGPLRLWCHLMANKRGWYTGLAGTVNRERRVGHLLTSFAWWPLGWILTIGDDASVEGAADVSDWVMLRKHRTSVSVELPCQWRVTPYPIDFRSPDEVRRGLGPGHQARVRLV